MKIITINGAKGCVIQCTREELKMIERCIEVVLSPDANVDVMVPDKATAEALFTDITAVTKRRGF